MRALQSATAVLRKVSEVSVSEPVKVALVGAGDFGSRHARAIRASGRGLVTVVVDPDISRARRIAKDSGVGVAVAELSEVDWSTCDAAVIANPSSHHLEAALAALSAGVPALVEKPVVESLADGRRLLKAEAASGAFVQPGHVMRFFGPHRELHRRLRAGEIGAVVSMSFRRHRKRSVDLHYGDVHPVRLTMIHDIDLALWLGGGGGEVISAVESKFSGTRQPAAVWAHLRGNDGSIWSLQSNWLISDGAADEDAVEVFGTQGSLQIDANMVLHAAYSSGPRSSFDLEPRDLDAALRSEVADFLDAVREGRRSTTVTLEDAVAGLEIAEEIIAIGGHGGGR